MKDLKYICAQLCCSKLYHIIICHFYFVTLRSIILTKATTPQPIPMEGVILRMDTAEVMETLTSKIQPPKWYVNNIHLQR